MEKIEKAKKIRGMQAILHRNLRTTANGKKVLLTNPTHINRDHLWIDLTNEIIALLPKTNRNTVKLKFDCSMQDYISYQINGNFRKTGVKNLTNIEAI